MNKKKQSASKNLHVKSNPVTMQGTYANAVKVSSTEGELILDFAFIFPNDESELEGIMTSRIILNHNLAKLLSDKLIDTLKSKRNEQ